MTIQVKATEQYFPVVLFIMLYKVVITGEFVDEIQCVIIQMEAEIIRGSQFGEGGGGGARYRLYL